MKYYLKFLGQDRQPYFGLGQWPPPGEWTKTIKNVFPCYSGYHLCRLQDFFDWCYIPVLWVAEAEDVVTTNNKVVAKRARLIRQVEEWNETNQRLFAVDCADHVLHLFESLFPYDKRPRQAIETSRRFAIGEATIEELDSARLSSEAAAGLISFSAGDAAWSAAKSASRSSQHSAEHSAWYAAESAAWSSERSIERKWQRDLLLTKYLKLNPEEFE